MKTQINYHTLTIPLEFRVACALYRLDEREVLQIFINHATVYDSLADPYSEGYSEASKTIGLYVAEKRRTPNGSHAFSHCLANAANCFRWINELAEKVLSSSVAKRKKSLLYIDELYTNMNRVYTSSDTFHLDENRSLNFTKDFTVRKNTKWTTLFFLQYTELMEQDSDTEFDLEDHYLQYFTDTLAENMEKYKDGGAKAREAGREVIREWQKAVLAERARYITDEL